MNKFQENNLVQKKIELIINKYKSPLIYENRKIICEKIIFFLEHFRENEIIKKNRKWLCINIISVRDIKILNYIFIYLKQFDKIFNVRVLNISSILFIIVFDLFLFLYSLIYFEDIDE